MKRLLSQKVVLLMVGVMVMVSCQVGALTAVDPAYQVEVVTTYTAANIGNPLDAIFDDAGNLYISHVGTSRTINDGAIYKIEPDNTFSVWSTGYNDPLQLSYTKGTEFGDYIYVADGYQRDIKKVAMDGTHSYFCGVSTYPSAMAVDKKGLAYQGDLYCASRGTDQIYRINPSGNLYSFSPFPGTIQGSPIKLAFDPGTKYGGDLFMSISDDTTMDGIYRISSNGVASDFTYNMTDCHELLFDSNGFYDYNMFVFGGLNGYVDGLYSVDIDGTPARILQNDGLWQTCFSFGPDGYLYAVESNSNYGANPTMTVYRVVPEPASLVLLAGAGLGLRWRRREPVL